MSNCQKFLHIDSKPLDLPALNRKTQNGEGESGAAVVFTGSVRVSSVEKGLTGMTLEHYPGMTEHQLGEILAAAEKRWELTKLVISHRVGFLQAGEPIVFVGVCGLHRAEAFDAAQFVMDFLKQRATFWKKEHYGDQTVWVGAKSSDTAAASRWNEDS